MTSPQDKSSYGYQVARNSVNALSSSGPVDLNTGGSRSVEAWFLGPKGENSDVFEKLIVEAIRDQTYWRRNYHPEDPTHITEEIKRSPDYLDAMGQLNEGYQELLAFLKKSVPFFSMRYQGHMNWDLTMPSMLGYFAAMLYNPNNVAFEGSTATTIIELKVGDDLCQMLGYTLPSEKEMEFGAIRPWGHITCDGTVANIEAVWAARNLKFYPLAFQEALINSNQLEPARELRIELPNGKSKKFNKLTTWELLNLSADQILALPTRVSAEFHISRDVVSGEISKYSLQNLGLLEFSKKFLGEVKHSPVVLVPGTKHYSFPKAVALLGLGSNNLIDIPVDLDARLDIDELRKQLDECLEDEQPVVAVVAVIGSTEESAIDPLAEVLQLRDEYAKKGLNFIVHADAAWGGYHRSVINEEYEISPLEMVAEPPVAAPLSQYSQKQFLALGNADSITVDPHKSGYIPYPAGALCYRNASMRDLLTFSAPVVFHGDAEPTVGIYGVEGSKPGAAAAAVYLSHKVIRPTKSGYGKIIGQALFSCRKLYARFLSMSAGQDPFTIVPLPRLPAERNGGNVPAEKARVIELIDKKSSLEIRENQNGEMELLQEIGPDENILAYAFNFVDEHGVPNKSLKLANKLNKAIYDRLSINPGEQIHGYDLIVSTTDISVSNYGRKYIEDFKRRLGVESVDIDKITILRSVVMDPWVTETSKGSFIDVLEREFRKAVLAARSEILGLYSRG